LNKPIRIVFLSCLLGVSLARIAAAQGEKAMPAQAEYVVVDSQEEAYTVFMKIAGEQLEAIRTKITAASKARIIDWEQFQKKPCTLIQLAVKVNEYRQYDLESGLIEVLQNYSAVPVGISWNGGIAFTYGDYAFAKKEYQAYLQKKGDYQPRYERDPQNDPLDPGSHFQALLGKSFLLEAE
jgi:hypothetical protein